MRVRTLKTQLDSRCGDCPPSGNYDVIAKDYHTFCKCYFAGRLQFSHPVLISLTPLTLCRLPWRSLICGVIAGVYGWLHVAAIEYVVRPHRVGHRGPQERFMADSGHHLEEMMATYHSLAIAGKVAGKSSNTQWACRGSLASSVRETTWETLEA